MCSDAFLGLARTYDKLRIAFSDCLGSRPTTPDGPAIPYRTIASFAPITAMMPYSSKNRTASDQNFLVATSPSLDCRP
jgi:hypothetical protein